MPNPGIVIQVSKALMKLKLLLFTCMHMSVSGDANFHMSKTGLTLGGFTQPSVAANLVELPQSQEKGLAQRFLWISPKPCFAKFATLEQVNEEFCKYLSKMLLLIT